MLALMTRRAKFARFSGPPNLSPAKMYEFGVGFLQRSSCSTKTRAIAGSTGTAASDSDVDLVSKVMSEMGRKGGKAAKGKGVKARMAELTPQERKELATKAARARWARVKKKAKRPAKTQGG